MKRLLSGIAKNHRALSLLLHICCPGLLGEPPLVENQQPNAF
jgi:hypothetical protein